MPENATPSEGVQGRSTAKSGFSWDYQKVTMNCLFRRHLFGGNAVAWPIEASRDGVVQLRAQKGDDETPFSSAPSWGKCGGMADRGIQGRGRTTAGAERWRWNAFRRHLGESGFRRGFYDLGGIFGDSYMNFYKFAPGLISEIWNGRRQIRSKYSETFP